MRSQKSPEPHKDHHIAGMDDEALMDAYLQLHGRDRSDTSRREYIREIIARDIDITNIGVSFAKDSTQERVNKFLH